MSNGGGDEVGELRSWFRKKASLAREKAKATVERAKNKVKQHQQRTIERKIEDESRTHAARVARAIARDGSGSFGSTSGRDGDGADGGVRGKSRKEALLEELYGDDATTTPKRPRVDAEKLKLLVSDGGVPDDDNGRARALVWKLCLGYLPGERTRWEEVLKTRRGEYREFLHEFCSAERVQKASGGDDGGDKEPKRASWIDKHKGDELAEQIDRDVMRVHPDMHFFNDEDGDGEAAKRKDDMRDALYVFAKLNPGVGYVQGMHEMIGCLLYVFANADEPEDTVDSAADAFYCLTEIFGEFRDVFVMELDATDQGIRAILDRLSDMIAVYGPEVHRHLDGMNLTTSMFAFRWITLLFTQDFDFADVLRLWDVMLASPRSRKECLLRLCVACVLNIGTELLEGDFAACMKMLQNYPPVDIRHITRIAGGLPYGIK